jgi:hypothetical protein
MVRSVLSKLQAKLGLGPLSDTHAMIYATIGSIAGLIGLFLLARLVIDWLEVVTN